MGRNQRIWFKRFKVLTGYAVWRGIMQDSPPEPEETGLLPWSWQGWLIFIATLGLGYGTASLALRFYAIRPELAWAGWAVLLVIVLGYLEVANRFSDKP